MPNISQRGTNIAFPAEIGNVPGGGLPKEVSEQ